MTVMGAGAEGVGSKVAQYGSTVAEVGTKMGTLRLTAIGEPSVEFDGEVPFPAAIGTK